MTQQQYTPVSWQDETTSQQGTLINAERLNQMQTAHHYADGLEETDTVPTADPGVAYHKIVYCTADNTLYRWDGTQWTADIDDPTRELLEEHEADHDNPHQVTKAQVGLGNCDDTADLDKPISTATQTALNAKADKSDTYTKAQVDTALATKADKATTYTKSETDTLLGGKADKSTTYTKTEIDTVMATKADKATTLAGYGITDAYTKSEADTLLAGKASTTAVQTLDTRVGALETNTYTKSQVDTYLAAKADDDAVVHKAGAETIPGAKTFTTNRGVTMKATQSYNTFEVSSRGFTNNIEAKVYTADGSASDQHFTIGTSYSNASREVWHAIAYAPRVTRGDTSEAQTEMRLSMNINNNNTGEAYLSFGRNDGVSAPDLVLGKFANGAWTPTMVNDALDAYAPMVRTTGNQPIYGIKNFEQIQASNVFRSNSFPIGHNNKWRKVATCTTNGSANHIFMVTSAAGGWPSFGILHTENDYGGFPRMYWAIRKYNNSDSSDLRIVDCVAMAKNASDTKYSIWIKGGATMGFRVMASFTGSTNNNDVTMETEITDLDDLSDFDTVYYSADYPF